MVKVDCTGVHCYNTETDHAGDEVILTVSAPVSLRDDRIFSQTVYQGKQFPFGVDQNKNSTKNIENTQYGKPSISCLT